MRRKFYVFFMLGFLVPVLSVGCASTNKNYSDAAGVVKTNTRSASGVNK